MTKYSLCWDCKRATGGCPWSDKLKPIKGWKAIAIGKTTSRPYSTYLVEECPGFVRDAIGGGLKRYRPEGERHDYDT